jgi:hypothetical protein
MVSGKVEAAPPGSLTCFLNNMGHGVQFAALGALACERAKKWGIGRSIPTEWPLHCAFVILVRLAARHRIPGEITWA